jgi:predicted kinase
MTEARLILICGLPGSGKTTLAKQLAPKVPAVRFCPDEWKHDLGIDYYDEEMRVRLEERIWRLGQELLGLGQSVILENGFWAREERDELRLAARTLGVAVELHYLEATVDELWRRLEIRNEEARPGTAPISAKTSKSGLSNSKPQTPLSWPFSMRLQREKASLLTWIRGLKHVDCPFGL